MAWIDCQKIKNIVNLVVEISILHYGLNAEIPYFQPYFPS